MKKNFSTAVLLAVLSLLPGLANGGCIEESPDLPPVGDWYQSPDDIHTTYHGIGLLVILSKVEHRGFSNIVYTAIPGGTRETFDSTAVGFASVNGSADTPFTLTGPVTVNLGDGYTPGATGIFNTEMTQLDLTGLVGSTTVMIRESPTLASTGKTTIQDLGSGTYSIDSFFDIFTELSVDGGAPWIPADASTHVVLTCPEPSTFAMLGFGGIGLALSTYRRRKIAV